MVDWFDIAYATLNILVTIYCFRKYLSSKKKPFKLFGIGFTCLAISGFISMFAVFPWLNSIGIVLYGYIRLGLYAVFTIVVIKALQLFVSEMVE